MYCKKCGNAIDDDSAFCKACGSRQLSENTEDNKTDSSENAYSFHTQQASEYFCSSTTNKCNDESNHNTEITGIVFSILSLITWILPLIGYPVSVLGIIFSAKGKSLDRDNAQCALVLSVIGFIATLINSLAGAAMFS